MPAPLLILCGPAFSGKSTLAAHLRGRWGFDVVSLDEINARRGLHGGQGIPDAEWARTAAIARDEARQLLEAPRARVVVDDTFCFRFLRDDFVRLAREVGRESVILVLATPEQEIRRRIGESAGAGDRPGIVPAVLERHLSTFEWPGEDEPHRVVAGLDPIDAWLAGEAPRW